MVKSAASAAPMDFTLIWILSGFVSLWQLVLTSRLKGNNGEPKDFNATLWKSYWDWLHQLLLHQVCSSLKKCQFDFKT